MIKFITLSNVVGKETNKGQQESLNCFILICIGGYNADCIF